MKRKSLGQIAYESFWDNEENPFEIDDVDRRIFNRVANAVAREVRKRDKEKHLPERIPKLFMKGEKK